MIRDITGTILLPGNEGNDCPGNGENAGVECCCDECDYLLCCLDDHNEDLYLTCRDEDRPHKEAYRGKGLASACISFMLQECAKRGIVVHWDAQNEASLHLAEKFGFEQACTYSVYFLPKRITGESVVC